jgi:hypothetical protein
MGPCQQGGIAQIPRRYVGHTSRTRPPGGPTTELPLLPSLPEPSAAGWLLPNARRTLWCALWCASLGLRVVMPLGWPSRALQDGYGGFSELTSLRSFAQCHRDMLKKSD